MDPEVRTLESGTKLARLNVATSETYTNKEGARIEQTEWHRITVWRGLADVAEKYLHKGRQVYVEGRLQTRQYKDKEGVDRYSTEIVGDNLQLIGTRNSGSGSQTNTDQDTSSSSSSQNQSAPQPTPANADSDEDDLPF
jgi:single-strand DNA-binding protein